MQHLFVPYEIALKLKEKGFREQCFGDYRQWDGGMEWLQIYQDSNPEDTSNYTIECEAPLYQQVIDWLANKHFADCYTIPLLSTSPKRYNSHLLFRGQIFSLGPYDSQSEAITKAIEEALKLIKS